MPTTDEEDRVLQALLDSEEEGGVVEARLTTDERVIARVTDGIYRQPGSALRELISNAYDADATKVTIRTDAPRFERIVVNDNGHGMTPATLNRMLHHIGGSAKRTNAGAEFGITKSDDPLRSPGGRKLIGKIGIGLFSVSQMTQSFQIITKTRGDKYSTVATVVMKQYSENGDEVTDESVYEAGKVKIWREKTTSPDSHGTTIVLTGIRPSTRKTLKSSDVWDLIDNPEVDNQVAAVTRKPPSYYIGRMDPSETLILTDSTAASRLPWDVKDTPEGAMRKMVDAMWNDIGKSSANPQLSTVFDYYLRMIWELALAVPVPYIEGHLFDQPLGDWASFFSLSNTSRGAATPIPANSDQTIRSVMEFSTDSNAHDQFDVIIDDVSLRRPVRFRGLPASGNIIKKPMVFLGKCRQQFASIPKEFSGGDLEFEAYLFWTPKLAPTEHRGSLIRIHGASGTLYDESFMGYQIAEQTRLKQITCEVFISKGLESALNIDRESFNTAHPHVVYLTRWLHSALRQLTNAQKAYARRERASAREHEHAEQQSQLDKIVQDVWEREFFDEGQRVPEVHYSATRAGYYVAAADSPSYSFTPPWSGTGRQTTADELARKKTTALVKILSAFDLLDELEFERRQRLVNAIYNIVSGSDD